MAITAVAQSGVKYASRMINGIKYERIKKVLPDGKVFSTIRETLKNGDSFSRTKQNGKTVVTTLKRNFVEPNSGNGAVGVTVKRFFPNGDVMQTDKFVNSHQDILSYVSSGGYQVIPVKKPFLTKETIITRDFYPKGSYPGERTFTCMVQDSPVGTSGIYHYNDANLKFKEMGFLKTKLCEKDGRIVPGKFYDRYVK